MLKKQERNSTYKSETNSVRVLVHWKLIGEHDTKSGLAAK